MFDTIVKILVTLAAAGFLIPLLPDSPFPQIFSSFSDVPFLGYLNWFIPIGEFAKILAIWAVAMAAIYAISWILRQLGIIGS